MVVLSEHNPKIRDLNLYPATKKALRLCTVNDFYRQIKLRFALDKNVGSNYIIMFEMLTAWK